MVTATLFLSGSDMSEDEYLETLSHSKRFEFTNGVVTAKRGPYMIRKSHVAIAEEVSATFREYRRAKGGFGGQTPTTNLSQGPRLPPVSRSSRRTRASLISGPSAGSTALADSPCAG